MKIDCLNLKSFYLDKRPIILAKPEELAKFESKSGIRIPSDYRDFLTSCNGGSPDPDQALKIKTSIGDWKVAYFLNFDLGDKFAMLPESWRDTKAALPRFLLPFCTMQLGDDDPFFGSVFLACQPHAAPAVYLVTIHYMAGKNASESEFVRDKAVHRIASSFADFIENNLSAE